MWGFLGYRGVVVVAERKEVEEVVVRWWWGSGRVLWDGGSEERVRRR